MCLSFAAALCICRVAVSQTAQDADLPTFRIDAQLVLVDVISETETKMHRRALLADLKREDFRVFDNGKEMQIRSFDSGLAHSTRPVALWLIVQCPEEFPPEWHSEFMRGKTQFLRPAFNSLERGDVVGVAHWCDNGTASIDLAPGQNPDVAISAVDQLLNQRPITGDDRSGELAMQRTVELIMKNAHQGTSEWLPVLLFLYGDHCGTYTSEADRIIEDVLETSGIVFGLSDGRWRFDPSLMFVGGQVSYLVRYYSGETGGDYYTAADPKTDFPAALSYILAQVHLRYTLGFKPLVLDGKRHTLRVELTREARKQHRELQLRFRTVYVPVQKDRKRP